MRTAIAGLKARLAVDRHPYFAHLEDGAFTREEFVETQKQFLFAVVFFSRPMGVLAARLPRPELRVGILGNVADEHGRGSVALSHEATFLAFLQRLGVGVEALDASPLWPEVRAFNSALTGLCMHDDVPTALAALGMIEDLFSGISARIGRAVVARGWLPADALVHYTLHEDLDERHADDFYRLLEPGWSVGPVQRYQITQGLELGAYLLLQLYRGLFDARSRRATREARGPHSLADGWWLAEGQPTVPRR